MQLMIAAAPPLRQMACGAQLPIANAAYRIENGVLRRPVGFAAMRGALAVFPAKHAAFRSIFGNFISEKYYFFPVLCYLTGDG